MTEELEHLLKNLKLRRILEIYDEQLRAADKDDISYSEFVTRLVRTQFQARQEGALEWRIQRAKLPERWTLETFPFARQPGVNRKQIRGFAVHPARSERHRKPLRIASGYALCRTDFPIARVAIGADCRA
jgi:DNA replication protein DnaC